VRIIIVFQEHDADAADLSPLLIYSLFCLNDIITC